MSFDKIELFANLEAKLFQEASGLSRWQELIINARKKKKNTTSVRESKMTSDYLSKIFIKP